MLRVKEYLFAQIKVRNGNADTVLRYLPITKIRHVEQKLNSKTTKIEGIKDGTTSKH